MKQILFLSRATHVALVLLFIVSCTAFQSSPLTTSASPTGISTRAALPTSTLLSPSATPQRTGPTLTQQIAPQVDAWLRESAIPFDTSDPNSDFQDLMPLKELIGDARIVALGEATHGTHEFFQMKHRILRFLVEEMGFNIFAIEANWPEANHVNDYVHSGQGDPAELLRGLYFWTWNTQEVLDMILWMRAHNENPQDDPSVSFFGFDMQFYTIAMDNVIAYLKHVDPDRVTQTTELFLCLRRFKGRESMYADFSFENKTECKRDLQAVYTELREQQSDYEALSSPEAFAQALQSSRIVLQAERMYGLKHNSSIVRDRYMAENITWLLDQAGPDAKMVLWAHNYHVSTYDSGPKPIGAYLREQYGEQMVVFGFSFYEGSFNSVPTSEKGEPLDGPTEFAVTLPPGDSYEVQFQRTELPRFFLDLRGLPVGSPATEWLLTPHSFRSVGSRYLPSHPEEFLSPMVLPQLFDVIIYFQDTSPSLLLDR